MKTYCFDIDGTICTNTNGRYDEAEPFADVIAAINALYAQGHEIIFFTARGSKTGIDWRQKTEAQLRGWGLRFHQLVFGKPHADVYIDDRAIHAEDFRRHGCLELVETWT